MPHFLTLINRETSGSRYDVTPIFSDPQAFHDLVNHLLCEVDGEIDVIAGIDALGFVLGAAMAIQAATAFLPIRKGGKLPVAVDSAQLVDYSGTCKTLELRAGAIRPGSRVLVVDEWVETGAQVEAAISLIEQQGGIVIGVAAIHVDTGAKTARLRSQYRFYAADDPDSVHVI